MSVEKSFEFEGISPCPKDIDKHRNVKLTDVCNSPEKFVKMVDLIDSPWVTACLAVGHYGLVGADAVPYKPLMLIIPPNSNLKL